MKTKVKSNWADPNTTAENEKLPGWIKWVWSSRGISYSLNFMLIAQITYYCTDLLGLPAALVGTLLLASKIFDGFTDLIVGFIIDKTRTKWGKARPYDIFVPLMWICTVLLFSTPNFGMTGKAIYVFILYTLTNSVCATFVLTSDTVFMSRTIRSEKNRVSVASLQGALVMIFSLILGIIMPQLIATIGTQKSGWTIIAMTLAVPLAILGSLRMLTVKEIINTDDTKQEKSTANVSFKTTLKVLSKNKLLFLFCVLVIITQMVSVSNPSTYYFKWVFGNIGLGSLIGLASLVTPFLLIFVPTLTRKIGTSNLLRVGMVINLIGCVIRMFFAGNIVVIMVTSVFTLAGVLPMNALLSIYALECMDYGEKKTGVRVEGVISALPGFSIKIGSAFGSATLGLLMGASGYISDVAATTQPDSAIGMMRFLFAVLPVIFAVVSLVVAFLFHSEKRRVNMA